MLPLHPGRAAGLAGLNRATAALPLLPPAGYEEADHIPAMFVLAGNFSSKKAGEDGGADYPGLRDGFNSLAALIERHSKIKVGRGGGRGG